MERVEVQHEELGSFFFETQRQAIDWISALDEDSLIDAWGNFYDIKITSEKTSLYSEYFGCIMYRCNERKCNVYLEHENTYCDNHSKRTKENGN